MLCNSHRHFDNSLNRTDPYVDLGRTRNTIFDVDEQVYRERPDKPNSTIDPDDSCEGFSQAMLAFLRVLLVQLAQAEEFEAPFCFSGEAVTGDQ